MSDWVRHGNDMERRTITISHGLAMMDALVEAHGGVFGLRRWAGEPWVASYTAPRDGPRIVQAAPTPPEALVKLIWMIERDLPELVTW